jgi:hypothetical protein
VESPVLIHRERVHPHRQSCRAMRGYPPQDESIGILALLKLSAVSPRGWRYSMTRDGGIDQAHQHGLPLASLASDYLLVDQ